ncbi:related to translation initiation factor IF-2, mitochondrial [Pseudozyma flocculosa]|uniref:Related to translation initiation factor IF-2, mitochondrial n=1 Tax=Pseudozyma flocculosa TaxID=84751 RepID=A0A5C3F180_9BASI|nr:related to translation initiation factor IF-2, mitochondrial [Pseudozyma flocculosa]
MHSPPAAAYLMREKRAAPIPALAAQARAKQAASSATRTPTATEADRPTGTEAVRPLGISSGMEAAAAASAEGIEMDNSPRAPNDRRNQQRGPPVPRPRDWSRDRFALIPNFDAPPPVGRNGDGADAAIHGEPDSASTAGRDDAAVDDAEGAAAGSPSELRRPGAKDDGRSRGDRVSRKKGDRGSLLRDQDDQQRGGPRPKDREREKGAKRPAAASSSKPKAAAPASRPPREVFLPSVVTVSNLARQMNVKMRSLQRVMTESGMTDTRPDLILAFADAEMLAAEFNLTAVVNEEAAFDILPRDPASPDVYATLPLRPPVVTIMGHVDHGKTTLLDKLRSTAVAAGEAGGITQHIGAFSVPVKRAAGGSDAAAAAAADAVQTVTFLDTPGHAAFTAMRSRGAAVTDIVVLVVAADDGVMPQTREVIDLVQSLSSSSSSSPGSGGSGAGNMSSRRQQGSVQMVVALTKVDKPESDAERVKRELLSAGVELEELGGDIPCVEVSGKTGDGLDELEETLAALAEMADLRAERDGQPDGYVIESKVEKARGNVATVLVKRGCVRVGELLVAGTAWCKVRQILDSQNKPLKAAYPGDPVVVTGWRDLAQAGEEVVGAASEADIKRAVENRKRRLERLAMMKDVEVINEQRRARADEVEEKARREFEERKRRREERMAASLGIDSVLAESAPGSSGGSDEAAASSKSQADGAQDEAAAVDADGDEKAADYKTLNLIVKADFTGTVEAVVGAISSIGTSEAGVKIIASGVGPATEGDVAKAAALGGHVICFNVDIPKPISALAARSHPPVVLHSDSVIYRLMDYVSSQVAALLPPEFEQRVTGEAVVSQLFNFSISSKVTRTVAGCKVTNGTVSRSNMVRILRGGGGGAGGDGEEGERKEIWRGRLDQMKHGKKDVVEMRKGTECGLSFVGFQGFKEGDVVQSFYEVEVPRKL